MSPPEDPLDSLLARWNPAPPNTSGLREEIWREIRRLEETKASHGILHRLETRFARPAFVFLLAATCVLGVLLFETRRVASRERDVNTQLANQYLRLIDPLLEAPGSPASIDRELAWMRDDLHLSPAQFAQIKELHEASGPELRALAGEVRALRKESAALETERRTDDQVDFLAVARLQDAQRAVGRECWVSTQKLVKAATLVMTVDQKRRYLRYVQASLSLNPRSASD
jgi:hypothetical protein